MTYSPLFFEENSFLVNKGVSGQTSVEMLSRFQEDVIKQSPKAVYILAGINDIAQNSGYISIDDISKNIIKMGLLAQKNNIKVVICSVIAKKVSASELTKTSHCSSPGTVYNLYFPDIN